MKLRAYWILLWIGVVPMLLLMPLWAVLFIINGKFIPEQYINYHVKIGDKI